MTAAPQNPQLKAAGFTALTPEMAVIDAAIISVLGDTGSGKTFWSLNAPGPVAYFDFDRGLHRAAKVFADAGKALWVKQYPLPPNMSEESAGLCKTLCDKFQADFRAVANRKTGVETIIVDTGSDTWELVRLAYLGKLSKVMPIHYAMCNSVMGSIVMRCRQEKINLILLHKCKNEYVKEQYTGKLVRHGWSETGYVVDAEIFLSRDKKTKLFQAEYQKAAGNPDLIGETYTGEAASFPAMMARMFNEPVTRWSDPLTGILGKKDSEGVKPAPPKTFPRPAAAKSTPPKPQPSKPAPPAGNKPQRPGVK